MAYRDRVAGVTLLTGGKDDTGWIAPTLLNGWTQYGTGGWDCLYRRIGGQVYVRGLVARAAGIVTSPIFNLPVGFRPGQYNIFPIIASSQTVPSGAYVVAAGDVYPIGTGAGQWSTVWNSLSGISFPADL